tara:strand:- start:370 stop:951 length:582 start_codon:yes stop_codon:yes gene_type:complete
MKGIIMTDYIKRIGELQLLADGNEDKLKKAKSTLGTEVNETQIEIGTIAIAWTISQKEKGQKLAEKLTLELNELKDSKGKPVYEYTLTKKGLVCNKLNKLREFANSKKVRETFSKNTSFEDISNKLAELELDSWSKMQKWAKDKAPETLDQKAWKIVEQMDGKDFPALDRFISKMSSTYNLINQEDARKKFAS